MMWNALALVVAVLFSFSSLVAADEGRLSIVQNHKALTVRDGEKTVLQYNIGVIPSPEKDKPYYARSGHIHPVYTPQRHVVTGDMCPDHAHQHAVWFAWTNVEFEGRKIDFWNSQAKQGRVEHVEVVGKESDGDEAWFEVLLRHLDVTGDEPIVVLRETWEVRVQAVEDVYVFDLTSTQQCVADSPLKLKKYHYGSMGLRSPMAWNAPEGGLLTSEGKTRDNGNHSRPQWVDSYGPVEGGTAGITVMQHPLNFRYPQPVRLHPKFSYFCYAPMVLGDFAIEPTEEYVSQFRYVAHDGEIDKKLTQHLWEEFAAPPKEDEAARRIELPGELFAIPPEADVPELVLRIEADGSLRLDDAKVNEDDLQQALEARIMGFTDQGKNPKDVILLVTADPQTKTGDVQRMIMIAQEAGLKRFMLRAADAKK